MPTYEYKCSKCGHEFEAFQSMTAAPLRKCPKCKGNIKRMLGTGAGLLFKGSGFYITDYRSDGYKKHAQSDGKDAATAKPAGASSQASDVTVAKTTKPTRTASAS